MKEKKETVKRTERDAKLHRQIEKRSKKEVKDSEHNNKKNVAFLFGLNSITCKIIKPLSEDKGNYIRCGALIYSYYVERPCSCS